MAEPATSLSQRFRMLVCDEAQWLSRDCFEYWRHLWGDRATDIAIVFVGGEDRYQVLRREPMLSSRVYVWQPFQRIPPAQVQRIIAAYHPIWENTDPEVIAAHAAQALQRLGRPAVDREVLGWVFARLTGRSA